MISTLESGDGPGPIRPAKVVAWLKLQGEIQLHYPEFFFIQSKTFSGKKVVTLCHKVSLHFGETVLHLDRCKQCEEVLKARGHHEPKTVSA